MKRPVPVMSLEKRLPVVIIIVFTLLLMTVLSDRVRVTPWWGPVLLVLGQLIPIIMVWYSGGQKKWRIIERWAVFVFAAIVQTINTGILFYLIYEMINVGGDIGGRKLLSSSVGSWITNVLTFSLVYWQIDFGGPEERANKTNKKPDWLFPNSGVPELAPDNWKPTYIDYLFLSFTTATAFSTTDTVPLTSRAKMLMMLESSISLITLVTVAARAINILGN